MIWGGTPLGAPLHLVLSGNKGVPREKRASCISGQGVGRIQGANKAGKQGLNILKTQGRAQARRRALL